MNQKWILELEGIEHWDDIEEKYYRNSLRYLNNCLNQNDMADKQKIVNIILKATNEKLIEESFAFTVDILINCSRYVINQEIDDLLNKKFKELERFFCITGSLPIDERNYYKDLSIETGAAGIAYEILRYKNPKMAGILELL